jgi:hypothetical protein
LVATAKISENTKKQKEKHDLLGNCIPHKPDRNIGRRAVQKRLPIGHPKIETTTENKFEIKIKKTEKCRQIGRQSMLFRDLKSRT